MSKLTYVEATKEQAVLIESIRMMEVAAVEHFRIVKAIKFSRVVLNQYFPNFVKDESKLEWKTELHGILPVILTDDYSISLELE